MREGMCLSGFSTPTQGVGASRISVSGSPFVADASLDDLRDTPGCTAERHKSGCCVASCE